MSLREVREFQGAHAPRFCRRNKLDDRLAAVVRDQQVLASAVGVPDGEARPLGGVVPEIASAATSKPWPS